jgi:hypothetical protein
MKFFVRFLPYLTSSRYKISLCTSKVDPLQSYKFLYSATTSLFPSSVTERLHVAFLLLAFPLPSIIYRLTLGKDRPTLKEGK